MRRPRRWFELGRVHLVPLQRQVASRQLIDRHRKSLSARSISRQRLAKSPLAQSAGLLAEPLAGIFEVSAPHERPMRPHCPFATQPSCGTSSSTACAGREVYALCSQGLTLTEKRRLLEAQAIQDLVDALSRERANMYAQLSLFHR